MVSSSPPGTQWSSIQTAMPEEDQFEGGQITEGQMWEWLLPVLIRPGAFKMVVEQDEITNEDSITLKGILKKLSSGSAMIFRMVLQSATLINQLS